MTLSSLAQAERREPRHWSAAVGGAEVVVLERAPVVGGTTAISGAGTWLPLNPVGRAVRYEVGAEGGRTYLAELGPGRER